jgi:IMP cyclohydrolase
MSGVVASGTVRVRCLETGDEWDELVEVFEQDLEDTDGTTMTVEDAARRQACRQAGFTVESLEADVS